MNNQLKNIWRKVFMADQGTPGICLGATEGNQQKSQSG